MNWVNAEDNGQTPLHQVCGITEISKDILTYFLIVVVFVCRCHVRAICCALFGWSRVDRMCTLQMRRGGKNDYCSSAVVLSLLMLLFLLQQDTTGCVQNESENTRREMVNYTCFYYYFLC